MAEESEEKKVDTGGGAYVGGDVHTEGGPFGGRDQKVEAAEGGVAVGGNWIQAATRQGVSSADLVRLVGEMQQLLPRSGLDAETAEVIEGDFRVIEAQAKKPQPKGQIILSKLKGVTELLTTAVAASEAAQKLLPTAQKLLPMAQQALEWAGTLFR